MENLVRYLLIILLLVTPVWATHEGDSGLKFCAGGYDDGRACTVDADCWLDEDLTVASTCETTDWNVEPGTMIAPTDPDFESGADPAMSAAAGFIHTGESDLICGSRNCVPSRCDLATNTCYDDGEDCNVDQDCSRCHTYGWQCVTNADCSSAGKMAIVDDNLMYCDEGGVVRTLTKTQYNSTIAGYEILGDISFLAWQDMIIDINNSTQRGTLRLVPKDFVGGNTAAVNITCPSSSDTAAANLAVCDPDGTALIGLYGATSGYADNDGFSIGYWGEALGAQISVYETAPLSFTTDGKLSGNTMVLEADGDLTTPANITASGNISDDSPWLLVTKTTDGGNSACTSGCTVYNAGSKETWGETGTEDADAKGTGLAWDSANHEVDVTLAGDYKVTVTEMVALGGLNNWNAIIIHSTTDGATFATENTCKVDPPAAHTIGYNSCVAFIDNMASGDEIRVESYGYFNNATKAGSTIEVEWLGP